MIHLKIKLAKLSLWLGTQSRFKKAALVLFLLVAAGLGGLAFKGPFSLLASGNRDVYQNLPVLLNGDELKIHVIDVGQGDATLLQYRGFNALIDTGPPESAGQLTAYLKALGIDRLDALILTHPHDDHVGNGRLVLAQFTVRQLLIAHESKGNELQAAILMEATRRGIPIAHPIKGTRLFLDDLILECLHPLPISYANINNYSSVWTLRHGTAQFLFLADLETDEAGGLPLEPQAFVRSGHHGSLTSLNRDLLKQLSPRLVAISCGQNNPFGHPSPEVLAMLKEQPVDFFRTDRSGTRVISSDGTSLRWVH